MFVMPSVVKGGGIVSEQVLSNWLTCEGAYVLMWHLPQHPTWDYITTVPGAVSWGRGESTV